MRIERLDVRAFGALSNRSFEFAPGMTLVHGANESGKSTLHQALYFALCGARRGRGKSTSDGDLLRYRPWNGETWCVSVRVRLEDGRRIEILQDLDDKGRSRAVDADLGTDCTAEIMRDGTPDAAVWLGLDRRAFLVTACVRQADLLGVRADPTRLHDHLQRAAATSGADATAAEALNRIDLFLKEHVGGRSANAVKPLRRALDGRDTAHTALESARAEHAALGALFEREEVLALNRVSAAQALERVQAARARAELAQAERNLTTARQRRAAAVDLPAVVAARERELALLEQELFGTDASRSRRTAVGSPVPVGPGLATVRVGAARGHRDGEAFASRSEGAAVTIPEAAARLRSIERLLEENARHRPLGIDSRPATAATPAELRHLAAILSRVEPPGSAELEAERRTCKRGLESSHARVQRTAALVGIVALAGAGGILAGLVLHHPWQVASGVVALVGGFALNLDRRRALARSRRFLERLSEVQARLAAAHAVRETWMAEHATALAEARRLEVEPDPQQLGDLANDSERYKRLQDRQLAWEEQNGALQIERDVAVDHLRYALEVAGIVPVGQPLATAERLEHCLERRAALVDLRNQLAQYDRNEAIQAQAIDALEKEVEALAATAHARGAGHDVRDLEAMPCDRESVDRCTTDLHNAETALDRLRVEINVRAATLPRVAEVEEAYRDSESELQRVQALEHTLETTRGFLQQAQDRIHRDIAPALAATMRDPLPCLTAGRYDDVRIDPTTLQIRVHDRLGEWRPAVDLSHGAAEQIDLLLRLALARHLVTRGEVTPLLLDEVTVHFDRDRKLAALDLLHRASRDQQVLLLTQEDDVLAWARKALLSPRDAIVSLEAGA